MCKNNDYEKTAITLIIAVIVISSPILIFVNPVLVAALGSTDLAGTIEAPSTISQEGSEFTTQATLSSLTARPTNNIVNTNSFYDVVFLTASPGAIKTIQVAFPAGTTIPSGAFFNEAEGIGPGTASKSGQTITYTVTNAVNVPIGTKIRLEFANINNPLQVSASYQVTVTTRDAANAIIDGPSQSAVYTIKQIGKNTIAESFMKRVTLKDDAAGNTRGRNPGAGPNSFSISEPAVSGFDSGFVILAIPTLVVNYGCVTTDQFKGGFRVFCTTSPSEGEQLHYVVINLPAHVA